MAQPVSAQQALQLLQTLRTPNKALPAWGEVHDQKTGQFIKYNPLAITDKLQKSVIDYYSQPPVDQFGHTKWMTLLGYRQGGKSTTAEYAAYCKAAYSPGWDHVCIADNRDRADYLHKRVHHLHIRWPDGLRSKNISSRESRQLTFDPLVGGKMRILSAESGAVGVGQSPDSFHASEPHLWSDFSGSMFLINPSIRNRQHCLVLFEATPWERNGDWHEHYQKAKRGAGRHFAEFFPFWDGKLNRRSWPKGWKPDNEELELLNRFGPQGLTLDNLAFRRYSLEDDDEIRKNPDMFRVMYPFDDLTCWIASAAAAIPAHVLDRHLKAELVEWSPPYLEYEPPQPGAIYAIGVDPVGYAARDHAAFQVLKCWDGEWTQVASYAAHTDPVRFAREVARVGNYYNRARIVVESNGVGQAVLALLEEAGYSNIYCEDRMRPGFTSTSKSLDKAMGWLIDALMDELVLRDKDTVEQLQTYKDDKKIEESPRTELVRGTSSSRRRDRHHWDKVSALIMAVIGARDVPRKRRPGPEDGKIPENIVFFTGLTAEQQDQYRNQLAADTDSKEQSSRRRASYRSVRRSRRKR